MSAWAGQLTPGDESSLTEVLVELEAERYGEISRNPVLLNCSTEARTMHQPAERLSRADGADSRPVAQMQTPLKHLPLGGPEAAISFVSLLAVLLHARLCMAARLQASCADPLAQAPAFEQAV